MKKLLPVNKIYLINLESRPDRLSESVEELNKAGIDERELFRGINWKALGLFYTWRNKNWYATRDSLNRIVEENMIPTQRTPYNKSRMPWIVWCFLSHYLIFREAYYAWYESIAIFEDDVEFVDDFKKRVKVVMKDLPEDWEMVLLWWNNERDNHPSFYNKSFSIANRVWGTHWFMVNKEWIKKIYEMFNEKGILTHVDLMMYRSDIKLYCVTTPLCVQRWSKSDIR